MYILLLLKILNLKRYQYIYTIYNKKITKEFKVF